MKLIYCTFTYGGRVCVRVQYSQQFYFAGLQPPDNSLILLDLPDLKSALVEDVLGWVKLKSGSPADSRREINEFPAGSWRKAVPDDYLEAENYNETLWQTYNYFSTREFDEFGRKWLGAAQRRVEEALQTEVGPSRIAAFKEIREFLERVYNLIDKVPHRLSFEIEKMLETIDRTNFDIVKAQTDDLAEWIAVVENFKSYTALTSALSEIGNEMRVRRLESNAIHELLRKFGRNLRQSTGYSTHPLWSSISDLIRFEQNVTGETIDLTEAVEEKVQIGWDLIGAKRIGAVAHNRNALVVRNKTSRLPEIFVSGERKLKFQIQKNGGRLEKFGCTLTIEDQAETKSIQPALLEIEKIDALANLDIDQALEKIAHLRLPRNHLVYYTAEKARANPKQARVLADLLIELLIGVDADIARSLARAQARGNRK